MKIKTRVRHLLPTIINTKPLPLPKFTAQKASSIGWRVLAGSFDPECSIDATIARTILKHIEKTGGKAALVDTQLGYYEIWRPLTELETREQTEERVAKIAMQAVVRELQNN